MRTALLLCCLLCGGLLACREVPRVPPLPAVPPPADSPVQQPYPGLADEYVTDTIAEQLADSSTVGRPGRSKIGFTHFLLPDSHFVVLRYFRREGRRWRLVNEYVFPKDDVLPAAVRLEDLTGDGHKDLSYVSAVAARGGNEVRRLFVYHPGRDTLTYVKNSDDYPNLRYNRDLRCLDAFALHGASTTFFLRLRRDSLQRFASVDLGGGLTVSEYDARGNETVIFRDPKEEAQYVRYKNYKPLVVNRDRDEE
ncbi:hypothetical protein [Flaviaesturariibacter amylovorans]|uniref:Lipoprotein n=1 Tax=Flaviaesturariibacter amylovorans TaxID=1084520 RepID=A0ABP8HUA7_9BACT